MIMTKQEYQISLGLGVACFLAALLILILGQLNGRQQVKLQKQQNVINAGAMSQQIGENLLRDMAGLSTRNPAMKRVLAQNGYTVSNTPPPADEAPAKKGGAK